MDKEKLIEVLRKDPKIQAAVLFGSEATGHANEESDIDVAVLYKKKPDILEVFEFKQHLSYEMGRDVDLVALNDASPILAMQVLKNGKPLFVLDKRAYDEYEIRLITDYADLKMLLKPFEENILKRKLYDG